MNNIALIWDLDGTLLNSYDVIVDAVYYVFKKYGYNKTKEELRKDAITYSVSYLFEKIEKDKNIALSKLKEEYSKKTEDDNDKIKLMPNALKTLLKLKEIGIQNYVVTHRGKTTNFVLSNNNIFDFFKEIITSQSGFARKPNKEAIEYLVKKYNLNKENTYYIGDRTLDMEFAANANIKSILYLPKDSYTVPSGSETYIISDLYEIIDLLKK